MASNTPPRTDTAQSAANAPTPGTSASTQRPQHATPVPADAQDDQKAPNFVAEIVDEDLKSGANDGRVHTRFPPEPNGYLHIGHAKSIVLNFGLAQQASAGKTNLRFDDTNPAAEDTEFVESIQRDIRWLGFAWDELHFASDYFEQLYAWAEQLIKQGDAYVDDQSLEDIRENRGNFYKPGRPSPNRDRTVEENLDLFRRMRAGEFGDGQRVLRAKIDMAHKNLNMRDPLMYRIRHVHHHRTGDAWCIYPTYDWTHGQSDALEAITHSVCTLEFEDHRPLYEWFLDKVRPAHRPRQIEFARLSPTYLVTSKRKLQQLVREGHVDGWDDPRMPTIAGMRRAGYTPKAIRTFCERVATSKRPGTVDISLLEYTLREDLNATSPRVFAVLNPLKVVIENYPEGQSESFEGAYNPEDASAGSRSLPFSRELFIERDDFMEEPMKKWFRLAPGKEVRLRYACLITCKEVIKDESGEVVELRCTWDPESRGGTPADGRKVKGTLHWVSAAHAVDARVRLYDRLFAVENPLGQPVDDQAPRSANAASGVDNDEPQQQAAVGTDADAWKQHLNPSSLKELSGCKVEPSLRSAAPGHRIQFERLGYFCVDSADTTGPQLIFNRTISLRDSWAKASGGAPKPANNQRKNKKKPAS